MIDYSGFDSNFVDQTEDAIKWVLRVRQEGHKWKLLPLPSIPELYPNMNNERDGSWKVLKKELADNINEITSLLDNSVNEPIFFILREMCFGNDNYLVKGDWSNPNSLVIQKINS